MKSSLLQCRLRASPHRRRDLSLRCVTCFQSPTGPAQTSGGRSKEWWVRAQVLPSRLKETAGTSPCAEIVSLPVQSIRTSPEVGSSEANPLPPSTCPANTRRDKDSQVSELGDAFRSGVR